MELELLWIEKKACQLYKKALESEEFIDREKVAELYELLGRAYAEGPDDCGLSKKEGINFLKKAFEMGRYDAIAHLSMISGNRLGKNDIEWIYENASKYPDNPACLFVLGVCYEFGAGIPKDFKEAFKCYQKSALMGYPWGMHHLAYAYFKGQGTKKNPKEGFKWELMAAEYIPEAQYNIGTRYLYAQDGVEENPEEAEKWLKMASKNGFKAADEVLEYMREYQE